MLEAGRGLDGRDDLPSDAQLGEGPERRLALGPEVPDRLVQADHPFLLDVVEVGADEEVAAGLGPGEPAVPLEERRQRVGVAVAEAGDQLVVVQIGEGDVVQSKRHGGRDLLVRCGFRDAGDVELVLCKRGTSPVSMVTAGIRREITTEDALEAAES